MGKMVLELQKDIIENKEDLLSILRKAKVISVKLGLDDFTKWIDLELNGYQNFSDIPEYRNVIGEVKAKNPYHGLIPVMMPSSIAEKLNSRKLFNPISELIGLIGNDKTISMAIPSEISELLCKNSGVHFPCYFIIPSNSILGIIESVKNHLLEWCLKLEKDGILGSEFEFDEIEKAKAKNIPQQINYYGTIVNGNISNSQVVSGNNNSNNVNINDLSKMIDEINDSIKNEIINENDKRDALEILEDIRDSIKKDKKKSIIKSAFNGLKDFLLNVGANVTAAIITAKMNGLL